MLFARLASADDLLLDGWVRPANSIKELVLPRHEVLYGYRVEKHRIELVDQPETLPEQIVIGAHPCDAAALPILDKVFNWDFRDEAYNRRREATTVITLACAERDEECFCTSVGLGPEAERGSDAMLFDRGDGSFAVRSLTEKGRAVLGEGSGRRRPDGPIRRPRSASTPRKSAAFRRRSTSTIPSGSEHALACLGCGACAYTCPVCHCFDIVDEGNAARRACGRAIGTPASFRCSRCMPAGITRAREQGDRQRQRIYHKFHMYPEKFGEILCTGCGNCARNCPVGLGVLPLVDRRFRHAEPV